MLHHQILKYTVARGGPGIVNLLIIFIFTRMMGPEDYGSYIMLVSYVGLVNVFVYQWLKASLLRFYNSKEYDSKHVGAFIFKVYCLTTLLILVSSYILASCVPSLSQYIKIGVLLLIGQSFFDLNLELHRAQSNSGVYGFVNFSKSVIVLIFGYAFLYLGFDYTYTLFVMSAALLVPTLPALVRFWLPLLRIKGRKIGGSMVLYGGPLAATFAMAYVVSFTDRFMLAQMQGPTQVGYYVASYALVFQILTLFFSTLNLAVYPFLIQKYEENKDLSIVSQEVFKLIILVNMPVLFCFVFFGSELSQLFFDDEFEISGMRLLPIMALSAFFSGLKCFYFDLSYQLSKNTKYQFYFLCFSGLLNIALNYLLIPIYGNVGAAYSTLIVMFSSLVMSSYFSRFFCRLSMSPAILMKSISILALAVFSVEIVGGILGLNGFLTIIMFLIVVFTIYLVFFKLSDFKNIFGPLN